MSLDAATVHLTEREIAALRYSPSTSYWLRDAIAAAESRDILDALNDAEALVAILSARWARMNQGR